MSQIALGTKLVGDIKGKFDVRSYQRGYRWGEDEVKRLLDDIYDNGANSYCLQPIVIRNNEDSYELVDGQQRLTTLYLIYKYLHESSNGFFDEPRFSLTYQTREMTEDILVNFDMSRRYENIDSFFICSAYETIANWFEAKGKRQSTQSNINKYFDENVKVIWYEVDDSQDANALFTRLNIGKIALTSAELVKAMFLCGTHRDASANSSQTANNQFVRKRKEEISLQWDSIEKDLHNDSLWYFLTNSESRTYQTHIDLILDMMADKPLASKDKYFTFFAFDELRKTKDLEKIWEEIQHTYLTLKGWFEDHGYYHKIGYLIASRSLTLMQIYKLSKEQTKSMFIKLLTEKIKESISINKNYGDLSYESKTDCDSISRLLLLFNIESVQKNEGHTQWFPFDKFKFVEGGKVAWSLEHIHAQHSEGLRTQEAWKSWLSLHLDSISELRGDNIDLKNAMEQASEKERLERAEFENLHQQVIELLSVGGNTEYLHSIANLALLNTGDNAVLSNSTFDVKRNAIVSMDKKGQFIPHCTKMVFLKYYTPSAENQLHFWGWADRIAYIAAINAVLADYLADKIVTVEMMDE